MGTGIHHNVDLYKANFGKDEISIVESFSQIFSITFARSHSFKNSTFHYTFLKPSDELKEQYRFQNEILLLISPYSDFDNRNLDFVDKLLSDFQNRLDKLCLVLVSKDNQIKKKITHLISQNPETRIIIPFSYLDFFQSKEIKTTIENRLKEYFYGRDLFAFESPLQNDAYFYGRTETVQFFYDKYKAGENSGLFGLRKIGKTSVLYALRRYLNLRSEISVFIDCQEPSLHMSRWYECLEIIINNIKTTLLKEQLIIDDKKLNSLYNEKEASKFFEEDLHYLYSLVDNRILIIFDEIENITFNTSPSIHWKDENDFLFFWQSIRSIYQKNPHLFSFIIAGVNPKTIETGSINGFDNPIFRMISPTYLQLFSHKDVEEMVKSIGNYMGLTFENEIYTFLTDDFGGHPFLIRQVCSKIHKQSPKQRPTKISKLFYKENITTISDSLIDYVEVIVDVLKNWFPVEYDVLEALALEDYSKVDNITLGNEKTIEHLLGYNLIQKSNSGKYHIKINAVNLYVISKSSLGRKVNTIEDKWEVVTTKRNKLELDLRKVVKLSNRFKNGSKAKEIFLKTIEEKRRARLEILSYDEIFKSEIYLNDLKTYIVKYWGEFDKIFENKAKFEAYMEIINQNRIDAHAKNLPNDELEITIISINWIQKLLDNSLS